MRLAAPVTKGYFFLMALRASLTRLRREPSVSIRKEYPLEPRVLKSISGSIPGFKAEIMLLIRRLERKQRKYSNPFQIPPYFSFMLFNSFGIETINTFIHPVVPSKTLPDPGPKWPKYIPVFRPKRAQKPYPMGRHIPI